MDHILVCYDVNTLTPEGRRRLRRVAKACTDYGQRVQLSVFECTVSASRMDALRRRLLDIVHDDEDSLRIYHLGSARPGVVESYGRDQYVDFTEPLVL